MLQPGPIGFSGRDAALFFEAAERIVFINRFIERLVPHRIGNDDVEFFQAGVGVAELGVAHRIAAHDFALHVVNDHVHAGNGVAGTGEFLPEELERARDFAVALLECQVAFNEQARRTAGVVVSFLALTRAC